MKPAPFEYFDPSTVQDAVALLDTYGDESKVLAGGQSLVPLLNFRLARPSFLVDINKVAELDYLRVDSDELAIGAMTRQRTLVGSALAAGAWSLLSAAGTQVGHVHIRNRGTIGGSVAHADPAAELPAALTALGARMVVTGSGGSRELTAADFFQGYFTTAIEPTELLTEIRVPQWSGRAGTSFLEVCRRRGDFAQVAVAAVVTLDEADRVISAGLGLAGAATAPLDCRSLTDQLVGQVATAQNVAQLVDELAAQLTPPADTHGSSEYRRQLVRHLVPRALDEALSGARAV